jgi:hypothetical protein
MAGDPSLDDIEPPDDEGPRKRIHPELTLTAIAGLDALATRSGNSRLALLEALGVLGARGEPTIEQIVAYARKVDRKRRNRQMGR